MGSSLNRIVDYSVATEFQSCILIQVGVRNSFRIKRGHCHVLCPMSDCACNNVVAYDMIDMTL